MKMETLQKQPTVDEQTTALRPEILFELSDDILRMESEFADDITSTAQELYEQLSENDPQTVRELGRISLAVATLPESLQDEFQTKAIEQVTHVEQAELDTETIPDSEQYRIADAQNIINRLLDGDKSVLTELPPLFQEALSIRMNQRINELDDGIITEGYFREEISKMVQVASNGLWANDYPDTYAEQMKAA